MYYLFIYYCRIVVLTFELFIIVPAKFITIQSKPLGGITIENEIYIFIYNSCIVGDVEAK